MERGEYKSITTSNNAIFIWMDPKYVLFASSYHREDEVAFVTRRLKNGQRITVNCPHAIKEYNLFAPGVDLFSLRVSRYSIDRKSKRNWLRIVVYFLNASIFNSFIC
mgnify:CR=1 FL=1